MVDGSTPKASAVTEKLRDSASERKIFQLPRSSYLGMVRGAEDGNSFSHGLRKTQKYSAKNAASETWL